MAAVIDCCISCGCSLLQKFGEEVVLPYTINQLRYLFNYKSLVDKLNNTIIGDLESAAEKLRESAEQARRNADLVYKDVESCLAKVDEITEHARALAQKINDGGNGEDQATARCKCGNLGFSPSLKSRRKIGNEACDLAEEVKTTLSVVNELLKNDKLVSHSAYEPSASTPVLNQGYEAFQSREHIVKDIEEALRDDAVTRIGVYGMPGIGKTMLVKGIQNDLALKKDKSFKYVIFVPVSQVQDCAKIQKSITEQLGMTVANSESEATKAKRIRVILEKGTFLVILDDVWKELKLDDIGIPNPEEVEVKGCKIMLTSRFRNVLSNMKVTKTLYVEALPEADAMRLFEENAGQIMRGYEFRTLAKKIVHECGGLPIALNALASTLKNQPLPIWKDTLTQLQQSTLTNNEVMNEKVYISIKMAYDFLHDEDAKALFLLCCLREEDANISMYYTFVYAVGLGLFKHCLTLEDAVHSTFKVFDKLKAHCLLLEGDYNWSVKMHDVVRDVGMEIAAKDAKMYNIKSNYELENQLKNAALKDSTAISLLYNDVDLPETLECPKLQLIWLWKIGWRSTPDLFFQETKELRVLDLSDTRFYKSPSSFDVLTNLRLLVLNNCYLGDISMIGKLRSLEFLDFEKSDIVELPKEIGNLTCLRSLSLFRCSSLTSIPPNVISKLTKLEELNMLYTPNMQWEVEGSIEAKNASLAELRALKRLQALHFEISSTKLLSKGLFGEKLERCEIVIDNGDSLCDWYGSKLSTNFLRGTKMLKLYLKDSCLVQEYDLEILIGLCNELQLFGLQGANNLVSEINASGFPMLKHFAFQNNDSLRYLAEYSSQKNGISNYSSNNVFPCLESLRLWQISNLEQMIHGQFDPVSFANLCEIEVKHCGNLRNLFPLSVAKNLQQLGSIDLKNLKMMDAIVNADGNIDNNDDHHQSSILFPRLHYLSIYNLPSLVSYLNLDSYNNTTNSPFFNGKVKWGISTSLKNLSTLYVWQINCWKNLFSVSVSVNLVQLGQLDIQECDLMEEIITKTDSDDQNTEKIVFPKLHTLTLASLPKLTRFCSPGISAEFPLLANTDIKNNCPEFRLSVPSLPSFQPST